MATEENCNEIGVKIDLEERREIFRSAMGPLDRRVLSIRNCFNRRSIERSVKRGNASNCKQFRVSNKKFGPSFFCRSCLSFSGIKEILNYFRLRTFDKVYTSSVASLLFSYIVIYFILIVSWAYVIYHLMLRHPSCTSNNPDPDSGVQSIWQDAFALSWTTFSTVGYGHIHPKLSQKGQYEKCGWIITALSVESFNGVLYAGCCSAFLFAKVLRIQAEAQVAFSEAVTIKRVYSSDSHGNKSSDEENAIAIQDPLHFPCPIMTIRIVNLFANSSLGGVLIDASASVTLNFGERESASPIYERASSRTTRTGSKLMKHFHTSKQEQIRLRNGNLHLFNRVWDIEHELNSSSPLLSKSFRNQLRRNNDKWQQAFRKDNLDGIFVDFSHIVVSIKAISESSATEVFGHHIYKSSEVLKCFSPVDILYTERKGRKSTMIDFEIMNDVVEDIA